MNDDAFLSMAISTAIEGLQDVDTEDDTHHSLTTMGPLSPMSYLSKHNLQDILNEGDPLNLGEPANFYTKEEESTTDVYLNDFNSKVSSESKCWLKNYILYNCKS